MLVYDQSSGKLYRDNIHIADGYSGYDLGKNNPKMEGARGIGPIPKGIWQITQRRTSKNTGPVTLTLAPHAQTDTLGRSEFRIHGDSIKNPGAASHGCIILPRVVREEIWASNERILTVIE